jgi:hypothetical protein
VGGPARLLGVVAQEVRTPAGRAFISVSTSSASGRRPVSGVDVQSPRVSVQATGVQCPVRASERPGVRHPVSAVAVRCRCVPVSPCPTGVRPWGAAVGRQPRGWDGRGRRARPPCPRPAPRHPGGSRLRRPRWAGEASFWTRPSLWEVVGRWRGDRVAGQDRPHACEDRPLVGEPGCAAR